MDDSAHAFVKVLRTDLGWPPAPAGSSEILSRPVGAVEVRPGAESDLGAVNDIFNHYVRTSHATFEIEPYTVDRRMEWFGHYTGSGPYRFLVADSGRGVVGYATSSRHRPKPGYDTSVETTVYVAPDAAGLGVGTALYAGLFEALEGEAVHRALAGIALPNPCSIRLHQRIGFRRAGYFTEQGVKFGQYWDVAWYQKDL